METLQEFAIRIGAELKPTCFADMPVLTEVENKQPDNFFCGIDKVTSWLKVKDPSGGLNKSGEWPFMVLLTPENKIRIVGSSY